VKKALYLDADETIWDVYPFGVAGSCSPPYVRIDEDILVGGKEFAPCFIVLKPKVRELIDWAKEHEYDLVLVSINDREPVEEALEKLELDFDRKYIGAIRSKVELIERDMKMHGIDSAIFIDDNVDYEIMKLLPKGRRDIFAEEALAGLPENLETYEDIYTFMHDYGLL
jgi:hypothetical protein